MRLILQCAACGTINSVGLTECGTCRATGFENLILLLECLHCFRVGCTQKFDKCSKLPFLGPAYELIPDPVDPDELARRWGVVDESEAAADKAAMGESLDADWEEELAAELAPTALEEKRDSDKDGAAEEDDKSRRELPG